MKVKIFYKLTVCFTDFFLLVLVDNDEAVFTGLEARGVRVIGTGQIIAIDLVL